MNRFQMDFDLDDEEDNALLADHLEDVERGFDFFTDPPPRQTRSTTWGASP